MDRTGSSTSSGRGEYWNLLAQFFSKALSINEGLTTKYEETKMIEQSSDQGKLEYKATISNDLAMAYLQKGLIRKKAAVYITKAITVR